MDPNKECVNYPHKGFDHYSDCDEKKTKIFYIINNCQHEDIPSIIIFPCRFVTLDIRNAIIGLDSDFRAKHFVLDHSKVNVMLILDLPFFYK